MHVLFAIFAFTSAFCIAVGVLCFVLVSFFRATLYPLLNAITTGVVYTLPACLILGLPCLVWLAVKRGARIGRDPFVWLYMASALTVFLVLLAGRVLPHPYPDR